MRLTARELLTLFAIGAAGGLVGDAGHVQTGTTTYLDDSVPFIWESALWFPVLVGLATASTGELRLLARSPPPGFDPRTGAAAIAAVIAIYAVTALVQPTRAAGDGPDRDARRDRRLLARRRLAGARLRDLGRDRRAGRRDRDRQTRPRRVRAERRLALRRRLWLPFLYLAFGVVAARLAELLVETRRPPELFHEVASSSPR